MDEWVCTVEKAGGEHRVIHALRTIVSHGRRDSSQRNWPSSLFLWPFLLLGGGGGMTHYV